MSGTTLSVIPKTRPNAGSQRKYMQWSDACHVDEIP